jgi:PhnB protein
MAVVNPYLSFNGDCEQAFDLYKSVFGGEYQGLMRWGDNPDCGEMPADQKNQVMHVALPIGDTVLMGSDSPMGPAERGSAYTVAVGSKDIGETEKIFNGLADGGQVTMPLQKTFWGATFGMLTDKFGVAWMINCEDGGGKPQ